MLAGTIGSRPVGSPANARAREYVVDQLKQIGFQVRVQETDARRHELGRTARVSNIIGILPGEQPDALGIVSHYDSSPDAPGATDDALGVAVTLEAARVLAAAGRPRWTLLALVTDGEEAGLMGAAALVTDREVTSRLKAYINLESIGSSGTSILFETGPGNGWLVAPWARRAPHPRGGSYAIEVYTRLPNDTDFSILKTRDVPGLNFAAVGDSYAYHTARDTPERLSRETVRTTGENVVSIATALQAADITTRTSDMPVFFDIGGTVAVSYGTIAHWLISALALIAGVIAWVRVSGDAVRTNGVLRWVLTIVWSWLGGLLVAVAMAGATWVLRVAREVYHPWYARPGRLLLLLFVTGVAVAWGMARLGRWLPARSHPARHPALTWSVTLPIWIALAAVRCGSRPPPPICGSCRCSAPASSCRSRRPGNDPLVRVASIVVLCVSGTLWLREATELSRFIVAIMGRLPIVTPFFVYAAVLSAAGLMVAPPFIAVVATERPLPRPSPITTAILVALTATFGAAYAAPAYTQEQPLRRYVRALQEATRPARSGKSRRSSPASISHRTRPAVDARPTVQRRDKRALGPLPLRSCSARRDRRSGPPRRPRVVRDQAARRGSELSICRIPREPGLLVTFVLPAGMTPARSSLPGAVASAAGRRRSSPFPAEGDRLARELRGRPPPSLNDVAWSVTPRLPWRQRAGSACRPGCRRNSAVWTSNATWVLPHRPVAARCAGAAVTLNYVTLR